MPTWSVSLLSSTAWLMLFLTTNHRSVQFLYLAASFEHDGHHFVSRPSPHRANSPSWLRSQNHVHLSRQFVRKQARWHPIFFQVFAKNSLIKNIFEEEKKFDSRTWLFWKTVPYLVYFDQGEDFTLTTELSEKVQNPHNQAIRNR